MKTAKKLHETADSFFDKIALFCLSSCESFVKISFCILTLCQNLCILNIVTLCHLTLHY